MSAPQNLRVVLASRPVGRPKPSDFRFEHAPIPQPDNGQVLLETQYLSLDPYMRWRISAAKSYAPPIEIGDVIVGGTVARVKTSRHPDWREGDIVLAESGWQHYALSDGVRRSAQHRPTQTRRNRRRRRRQRGGGLGRGPDCPHPGRARSRHCRRPGKVRFREK